MGISGKLNFNWTLENTAATGLTTWIAWDDTSHANSNTQPPSSSPGGRAGDVYPNDSQASKDNQTVGLALQGLRDDDGGQLNPGDTIYYRVVGKDQFGNVSWSAEQAVTISAHAA